ncbi:hypothetical protein [Liberibacter crescens]|uniref:hypothetical protein n=1 Tax=Liberibacter crescens TaxID=1273132 RepID=UPI0012ECF739|nr:hypothetical protein [Liberibacter crescens]
MNTLRNGRLAIPVISDINIPYSGSAMFTVRLAKNRPFRVARRLILQKVGLLKRKHISFQGAIKFI